MALTFTGLCCPPPTLAASALDTVMMGFGLCGNAGWIRGIARAAECGPRDKEGEEGKARPRGEEGEARPACGPRGEEGEARPARCALEEEGFGDGNMFSCSLD